MYRKFRRHHELGSSFTLRVPNYRDLTPEQEWDLERGLNRVTDTCIPEHEAFVVCKSTFTKFGKMQMIKENVFTT
jgi:hypothetical protein